MKIDRKYGVLLIALLVLLAGCQQKAAPIPAEDPQNEETLHIVTTIFPAYDWAKAVIGDEQNHVELSMLADTGVDLHSFQPTSEDMMKITQSDIFIYVGGESDAWVEPMLAGASREDLVTINLMDVLGNQAVLEETVEGMEEESEAGASHDHEAEYDEHVWLSLNNAKLFTAAIADALKAKDPSHAEEYSANAQAYTEKLAALDEAYRDVVDASAQKTLLFGDRFPFRYLTDDYGLTYYAAFAGCSAESEASFETVIFLAQKVDDLGLNTILTLEKSDAKIAQTIRDNTASKDQQILVLNSMQSWTKEEVESGVSYLSIMKDNLDVLQEALH